MHPPAAKSTTEDSTNGIAYFFSLAFRAGTMNRQICHRITGRARMIPPYMPIRRRVDRPSVGLMMNSSGSQNPGSLLVHRSMYGCTRKSSTWS